MFYINENPNLAIARQSGGDRYTSTKLKCMGEFRTEKACVKELAKIEAGKGNSPHELKCIWMPLEKESGDGK